MNLVNNPTTGGASVPFLLTEDLINQAMNGDQDAITTMYNHSYNNVYQSIRRYIKSDEEITKDLVQESFIRGFSRLQQLKDPGSYNAWMRAIAANTAKNYLRGQQEVLFRESESLDGSIEEPQIEDTRIDHLPEIVLDKQETSRLMSEILESLSPEQRMAIMMFYYDELSVKEIAASLDCSENTVKSRLNYGRAKIKEKVLELERKGTKLYGLVPITFFMLLLRKDSANAAMLPDEGILSNIQQQVQQRIAGEVKNIATKQGNEHKGKQTTAEQGTGHRGKKSGNGADPTSGSAFKIASTKFVISGLCVGLAVVGGIIYPMTRSNKGNEKKPTVAESTVEESMVEKATGAETIMEDTAGVGTTAVDNVTSESPETESTAPSAARAWTDFEQLKNRLQEASAIHQKDYAENTAYYDELYTDLGDVLPYLINPPEDSPYALAIGYRIFDADGDGEDEFLVGHSHAPWSANVFAIYEMDGTYLTGYAYGDYQEDWNGHEDTPPWDSEIKGSDEWK